MVTGVPGLICTVTVCAGRDRPGTVSVKVSVFGVTVAAVFDAIFKETNPVAVNFGNGLITGTSTDVEYGDTQIVGLTCATNANELTVRYGVVSLYMVDMLLMGTGRCHQMNWLTPMDMNALAADVVLVPRNMDDADVCQVLYKYVLVQTGAICAPLSIMVT